METLPDFQKKSSPSGLYIVLDQGMGTKLNGLVVIALGFKTGDPGPNLIRGMYTNCPNVVSFLQKLFVMQYCKVTICVKWKQPTKTCMGKHKTSN